MVGYQSQVATQWYDADPATITQKPNDLWGVLDIEVEDGAGLTKMCVPQEYRARAKRYKIQHPYGRAFFRDEERDIENSLQDIVGETILVSDGIILWQQKNYVPKMRIVGIVTRDEAQEIINERVRYW